MASTTANAPCRSDIGLEGRREVLSILLVQVDPVLRAAIAERDRPVGIAAVDVIDVYDLHLLYFKTSSLAHGVQEVPAGLFAASAGLGADPAVLVHRSVPLALVTAALADGHAGLKLRPGRSSASSYEAISCPETPSRMSRGAWSILAVSAFRRILPREWAAGNDGR
jgi:hypothetical protein